MRAREDSPDMRCALCHADFEADAWTCERCGTKVHAECLGSVAKCPTLGCVKVERPAVPVPVVRVSPRSRRLWSAIRVVVILILVWVARDTARALGVWPFNPTRSFRIPGSPIWEVAFSGDGEVMAALVGGSARTYSIRDGSQGPTLGWGAKHVAVSRDGALVLVGSGVFERSTGTRTSDLGDSVQAIALSSDGRFVLATIDTDTHLEAPVIVRLASGEKTLLESEHAAAQLSWSPDETRVAGVGEDKGQSAVFVWDSRTGKVLRVYRVHPFWDMKWANGHELIMASWPASDYWLKTPAARDEKDLVTVIRKLDLETGLEQEMVRAHAAARKSFFDDFAFNVHALGAEHVAMARSSASRVLVSSAVDGSTVGVRSVEGCIDGLWFSPDERFLVVGTTTELDVFRIRWW